MSFLRAEERWTEPVEPGGKVEQSRLKYHAHTDGSSETLCHLPSGTHSGRTITPTSNPFYRTGVDLGCEVCEQRADTARS